MSQEIRRRRSGILLPIFSLPGPVYAGSLGRAARRFVEFLADAGQQIWQMLPVNPIDSFHSPYSSASAFAGEILYLDLEEFLAEGLIAPDDLKGAWGSEEESDASNGSVFGNRVLYEKAYQVRLPIYRKAFENYRAGRGGDRLRENEEAFQERSRFWLDDYLLFRVLADRFGTLRWTDWPEEYRRRNPQALAQIRAENRDLLDFYRFCQLAFDLQWGDLKRYANGRGVELLGDVPIYVGAASADTWARPELFHLDENGQMNRVSGAPADAFNPDGQRWNSPLYRWDRMEESGYQWWLRRLETTFARFDAVRLDHFIGFYNFYSFPVLQDLKETPPETFQNQNPQFPNSNLQDSNLLDRRTPVSPVDKNGGFWAKGPAEKFLDAVFTRFPKSAFIAEDLGVMTPGVCALRDHYSLPGMEVLQFSYDGQKGRRPDPMTQWRENAVACSGTHDTQTLLGWLAEIQSPMGHIDVRYRFVARALAQYAEKAPRVKRIRERLVHPKKATENDRQFLTAAGIRGVMNSRPHTALFPLQDFLGLDADARMNFPGRPTGNWEWRLRGEFLTPTLAAEIRQITRQGKRLPANKKVQSQVCG